MKVSRFAKARQPFSPSRRRPCWWPAARRRRARPARPRQPHRSSPRQPRRAQPPQPPTTVRSIATGPPSDHVHRGAPGNSAGNPVPRTLCRPDPTSCPPISPAWSMGSSRGSTSRGSQLTLDKIDWFTGAAAAQACDEDGVPQDGRVNEWCSMYYFRNVNPALRVVTVSPQVAVTTLDGNSNVEVAGDLAALADRVTTPPGSSRPYRLTVTDGVVIDVTELYQP